MIDKIASNIQGLAVDVKLLTPLENNARLGNVDAIMASYAKFGQVKPIVAVENDAGGFTVIAGNHQLEAAKRLGSRVGLARTDSPPRLLTPYVRPSRQPPRRRPPQFTCCAMGTMLGGVAMAPGWGLVENLNRISHDLLSFYHI